MGLEAHVSSRVVTLGVSTGSHSSCDPVGTEVDGISPGIPKSYIVLNYVEGLPMFTSLGWTLPSIYIHIYLNSIDCFLSLTYIIIIL